MAIRLNSGESQYLQFDSSSPLGNFTIMAWYYPITLTANWHNIFYMESNSGSCAVQTNSSGVLWSMGYAGTTTLVAGNWYHIALVNNATFAGSTVYLNGVSEVTDPDSYLDLTATTWIYAQIGRWQANADYMDGRIAHVKYYNKALNASEIGLEMYTVTPRLVSNLFSWHPTLFGPTERYADFKGHYLSGLELTGINGPTDEAGPNIPWGSYLSSYYTPSAGGTVEQEGYRWRNNDGSESAATWKANQDTSTNVAPGGQTRLRVLLNATNDPATSGFQLEARRSGSSDNWEKVGL